jgi:membrane protease YdiL (CAAX protease family)
MSSWSQLFFLVLFSVLGIIIATLLTLLVSGGSVERMQSIDFLRVMQIVQATCLFLLPACLCAYLFHEKPWSYLKIDKAIDFKFLGLAIILIVAIQPLISFTGYYNNLMTFPESLAGFERWMRAMENSTQALIEKLLTTQSVSILLLNIFVIAVMAGVTEEFFFRGSLQQIFKRICKNQHVAVWVAAFIFSFIHFQFYGFVPRLILGAVLGYIFLWAGNLWIPVVVHAFNNLMSVLIFHFYHDTPFYQKAQDFGTGDTLWAVVVSVALSGGIMYLLSKEYQKNNTDDFTI